MAQSFTTDSGVTLVVPSAVVQTVVQSSAAGVSTTGVIALVGEADAGPSYANESDITQNVFGPDQLAAVQQKYVSGPIVDAFRAAVAASNDPQITGAPTQIYISKTNISTKAVGSLLRPGLASGYGTVGDKGFGANGNLVNVKVTANSAEVAPTTGSFTFIPSPVSATLAVRSNGSASQSVAVSALTIPSAFVGSVMTANTLNSVAVGGIDVLHATGGENRGVITAPLFAVGISVLATGNSIVITLAAGSWAVTPSVGDTLLIPDNGSFGSVSLSPIEGAGANLGSYVVTAASSTTITATKLRNIVAGALIPPVNVIPGAAIIAATTDVMCFSPVVAQSMTGTERSVLVAGLIGQTVLGTASGSQLTLTLQTGAQWSALPQVGDKLLISASAPAAWRAAGNANAGWYTVTSATNGTGVGASKIVLTRISNGSPISFGATAIVAITDFRVIRPAIDGVGKSLEFSDGGGTEDISAQLFTTGGAAVTWLSTSVSPKMLVSATEFTALLTANRQSDATTEQMVGVGDVVLRLGYHGGGVTGVTGSATISGTTLTTTVTGGTGSNLSINLKNFKTIGDLAVYINSQSGYVCSVGSALYGQYKLNYIDNASIPQVILDKGTWGIGSSLVTGSTSTSISPPGRIKRDAYGFYQKMVQSTLVQLGTTLQLSATAGQPEIQDTFFLAGGARGATSNSSVVGAIDAMEKVRCNFLVTLFSRDATDDAAEGITDASSSYEIDSVNAYGNTHALKMSDIKLKRYRQFFGSKKTSFTGAKLAAQNIAGFRSSMAFQDFKGQNTAGDIVQFQPWYGAVLAAGMQAAGFYKPIVKKFINCSGVLMADGSFSDQVYSQVQDALEAGLLVAEAAPTGGFRWVSDQTTYSVDNNFVFNSIQAIYAMDIVALTIANRLELAFVGQSLADVSASIMVAYLAGIMADLKRIHLTAASDDAPLGFKDASVRISGPAAEVNLDVKLATGLYFISIKALISQVTTAATI